MPSKTDLLMHPVRLRIVLTLMNRTLTALQLNRLLPDIAQATLYRHLRVLHSAGLVTVVEENQVHSVLEKVYALASTGTVIGQGETEKLNRDQHMQMFTLFVAALLANFERYMERDMADLIRDQVLYRQLALYLTDEEFNNLFTEIGNVILQRLTFTPQPGRKRRTITMMAMPDEEES